jgi:hypothetical protein
VYVPAAPKLTWSSRLSPQSATDSSKTSSPSVSMMQAISSSAYSGANTHRNSIDRGARGSAVKPTIIAISEGGGS